MLFTRRNIAYSAQHSYFHRNITTPIYNIYPTPKQK